jgi:hypothetical protein
MIGRVGGSVSGDQEIDILMQLALHKQNLLNSKIVNEK